MADGFENLADGGQGYVPRSTDPANPKEGDKFESDGTPRAAGFWQYLSGLWRQLVDTNSTQTLENKSIDAANNTVTISTRQLSDTLDAAPSDGEAWIYNNANSRFELSSPSGGITQEVLGMTINATTSAPTKGTTSEDSVQYQIIGDQYYMEYRYRTSSGGAAGSGQLPAGLQFDATKVNFYTGTATGFNDGPWRGYGIANLIADGNAFTELGYIIPYDATTFRVQAVTNLGTQGYVGSAFFALNTANMGFTFQFKAPIS